MKIWQLAYLLLSLILMSTGPLNAQDSIFVEPTPPAPKQIEVEDLSIFMNNNEIGLKSDGANGIADIKVNGEPVSIRFENGTAGFEADVTREGSLFFLENTKNEKTQFNLYHISESGGKNKVKKIPLWLSIVPPLIAIILALIFKEVIFSLFIGIWSGVFIATGMRPGYLIRSFWEVVEKYVISALADADHMSVIIFSLLIGGMVAIISRNGGMAGIVNSLSRYAKGPVSAQFTTWIMGVVIFFDDYANTLIVGNTMRSVTDKFKVSREKLAYIVDSTAAPVAAIFFITTWIGAELGYIQSGIDNLDNFDTSISPYSLFINSLKYSFYPVLTLIFILIIIFQKKDFGPMYLAEKRARDTGQVSSASSPDEDEPNMEDLTPVKGAPLKWYNAAIPVIIVISMTIYGLIESGMSGLYDEMSGMDNFNAAFSWSSVWSNLGLVIGDDSAGFFTKLGTLIGASNSYQALIWASLSGVVAAIILTLFGKIMKLMDVMHSMVTGFKTMLPALIILTLAWSLALTTNELHTADYLTSLLADNLSPYLVPVIVFILAAFIAFSTGSSWSTMAILYPIAIPLSWAICQSNGMDADISMEILLNVISVTLAASVLGDHCSPISDTTILSSLASDCNHIDHVKTQLPYALVVGATSLICTGVSTLLGGGWLISFMLLFLSISVLYLIVVKFGKEID